MPDHSTISIVSEKTASVHALGCRLNQYETHAMEQNLRQSGFKIVPFGESADLGVINTCTVTNEADGKSRNAIRRFIRKNPSALTIVVGCYSQISANEIALIEGVDYVIGNHDKLNFLDYISEEKPDHPIVIRDKISRSDFSIGFVGDTNYLQRSNLKIQDGCDFMCTFCVIPFSRGRARSRSISNLLEEALLMSKKGVLEVVLTGVNLGTYNSEGQNFLDLIHAISNIEGLRRIRISSIEPTTIPEGLFELMTDESHPLMPYFHVPLQSGCDRILKKMRRKYLLDEMGNFFCRAIDRVPGLCLGTDLMVGFPGETNEDFEETCKTFMDFPFNYCHVFTFSERSGTPAAKMENSVLITERKQRSAKLRNLSASKRFDFHRRQIGTLHRVLVENPKDGILSGYTDNFLRVVIKESDLNLANKMIRVRIEEAKPEFVVGDFIEIC